jgi:hypothetical protein
MDLIVDPGRAAKIHSARMLHPEQLTITFSIPWICDEGGLAALVAGAPNHPNPEDEKYS